MNLCDAVDMGAGAMQDKVRYMKKNELRRVKLFKVSLIK